MKTQELRNSIHHLIDQIDDEKVLGKYLAILESTEVNPPLFSMSDTDLIQRAEASILSVEAGKVRDIRDFKKDFERWKKERTM